MKHPILFLSACLTVLTLSLNAQTDFISGFYVTNQFDTIYGEIDNRGDIRNSQIQLTSEYHDFVCDGEKCIICEKPLPVILVTGGPCDGRIFSAGS